MSWASDQVAKCEECQTDKPFLCDFHSEMEDDLWIE